jgi:hypothetical protein
MRAEDEHAMPPLQRPQAVQPLLLVAAALCGASFAGCGGASGAGSPQEAVSAFLAPYAKPFPSGPDISESKRKQNAKHLWQTLCDHVDPAIRRGLRFYKDSSVDARTNCGAVISLLAGDPGEGGPVGPAATMTGTPRSALTTGSTSIVTVVIHYVPLPNLTVPPPPRSATIKVLTAKRNGRWWVGTPRAFNPAVAVRGGETAAELRAEYAKLLAAAR